MTNSAIRNMAVMLWSMSFIKGLDQEDMATVRNVRIFFALYTLFTSLMYFILHRLIIRRSDQTIIKVPPPPPNPFGFTPPSPDNNNDDSARENQQSNDQPKYQTTMEYDLSLLSKARYSWASNTALLTAFHYKMGAITPLLMSAIMGLNRFLDDPLVQLHILKQPATGSLKRPFVADAGPLMGMLKNMMGNMGKKEEETAGSDDEDENDENEVIIEEVDDDDDDNLDRAGTQSESKKDK